MKAAITCQVDLMVTANSGLAAQSRLAAGLRDLANQIENDRFDAGGRNWTDEEHRCLGRVNLDYIELGMDQSEIGQHQIKSNVHRLNTVRSHSIAERPSYLHAVGQSVCPSD